VLCLPLIKQRHLTGVLYFENNLAPGVFTPNRQAMLELIASQAAISLEFFRHTASAALMLESSGVTRKARRSFVRNQSPCATNEAVEKSVLRKLLYIRYL